VTNIATKAAALRAKRALAECPDPGRALYARDLYIVQRRSEAQTYEAIAQDLWITRERVRQIERRALETLAERAQRNTPADFYWRERYGTLRDWNRERGLGTPFAFYRREREVRWREHPAPG
jgi:hypothetical protein